ncbi:MAG TPA: peptide deformylase [Candidatus Saccharimonadales bacterium]|nr:peptide deformylase [Candidatus Saccharimonadales bacterium]
MVYLRARQFGDPVLRTPAKLLSKDEILSSEIQQLIADMKTTIEGREYGVGLAAPQIGKSVAISVISVKPTPSRPKNPTIGFVIINPKIIKAFGSRTGLWEGCVSFGGTRNFPYAKALRYKKVQVEYLDENAKKHTKIFDDILAHVLQHETDHLNGVLFVDKVRDTKTYMTVSEYKKRMVQ